MNSILDVRILVISALFLLLVPVVFSQYNINISIVAISPSDTLHVISATDIAYQTTQMHYPRFEMSYQVYEVTNSACGNTLAPSVLSNIRDKYQTRQVSAFIGPLCTEETTAIGDLAADWNIPLIVSGTSTSDLLDDKSRYTTLTRTSYKLSTLAGFVAATFRYYGWRHCAILGDDVEAYWRFITQTVGNRLKADNVTIHSVSLSSYDSTRDALEATISEGRVILLTANGSVVRQLMLDAFDLGLIDGNFTFFSFNLHKYGDDSWKQNDDRDEDAKLAYQALMTFRLFKPSSIAFHKFQQDVERRLRRNYNLDRPKEDNFDYLSAAIHDSVILYTLAVNETLRDEGDLRDGYTVTRRMWNRTFEGISGQFTINENGERDGDFSLWDMADEENGVNEVVANFYGASSKVEIIQSVNWPGNETSPPLDTPYCGFYGENPDCTANDTGYLSTVAIGGLLLPTFLVWFLIWT